MKTKGFTIWELLLVFIILFAVAVFFFPVICHRDPGKVRMISCLSNEKQLGLGILQYVQDNDMMMPDIAQAPGSPVTWRRVVFDYVKSERIYQCPDRNDKAPGPDGLPHSYGANYSGSNTGGPLDKGNGAFAGAGSRPIELGSIKDPANLISLCEVAGSNLPQFNIDDAVQFGPKSRLLWAAHFGGGDYVFADGHAKWRRPLDSQRLWYRDSSRPLSANGMAVLNETQARAKQ